MDDAKAPGYGNSVTRAGKRDPGSGPPATRNAVTNLSNSTIFRILAAVVLVWLWLRLWQWALLFLIAAFLAVGLDPLVTWLDARRLRRTYAAPLVVLLLALLPVGFAFLAGSSLVEQATMLGGRLGEVQQEIAARTPPRLLEILPKGREGGAQLGSYVMWLGQALVSGLLSIGVALVLTVYFLIDGRRTCEWFIAFAAPDARPRVRETAEQARLTVLAYVRGNLVTSALAALCAYIAMVLLKVPGALLLALLTGLLDLIPVIGIVLSALPAILLGLTVSMWTGIGVTLFHASYNAIENYYIVPKVYGSQLRLSSLAVIAAFAVGAELGGVVGALVALPIVAIYPTVERLWLADRVGRATVQDHQRIERTDEH